MLTGVGFRMAAGAAALGIAWTVLVSSASASPLIDEGVQHFDEADFVAALQAFEAAASSDDLSREELVQLIRYRALTHFAVEDSTSMERELLRLAELEPGLVLGSEVPPQVRAAFSRARDGLAGSLALEVQTVRVPDGVEVHVVASDDPAGLVGRVDVAARTSGSDWVRSSTGTVSLPASPGESVELFASGVGPGGVVIVTVGSEDAPERRTVGGALALDPDDDGDDAGLFIGLGVGGGVLLVATAVLIIVFVADGGSNDTVFGPPVVTR